jgi:hypothetical protein
MSQNNTKAGHSGHQGMNPDQHPKGTDQKAQKQGDMGGKHDGKNTQKAGEGTERGHSGKGGS